MSDNPEETAYYLRLISMYIDIGTETVVKVFYHLTPKQNVKSFFSSPDIQSALKSLSKNKVLSCKEYKLVLYNPNPEKFDISLLVTLLTNLYIGKLPTPQNGWKSTPDSRDFSIAADLLRLRNIRNTVVAHQPRARLFKVQFDYLWKRVEDILLRLIRKVDSTSETILKERISAYKDRPLDPQNDGEQKYLEKLRDWWENCEEISKLQEQVEILVKKTKEFVLFFKSPPERYVRYIKLLFDGGRLVLNGQLVSEISKQNETLETILRSKQDFLKDKFSSEQMYKQLFPGTEESTVINTDIETWDITVMAIVIISVFSESIDEVTLTNVSSIMDARNDYAKSAIMASIDSDFFTSCCEDLLSGIRVLSCRLGNDIYKKCNELIVIYKKKSESNSGDVDHYFEELRSHGSEIKTIAEVYKETVDKLKDSVKQMEEAGIAFKREHVLELKMVTLGTDKEKKKVAEDTLEAVWQAALKTSKNPEEFEAVRQALDIVLNDIRRIPDVRAEKIDRHCIILSLRCFSWQGLLLLTEYLNSPNFERHLKGIADELYFLYDDVFVITGKLTAESMLDVLRNLECPHDEPQQFISLPIQCTSAEGMRQVLDIVGKGSTINRFNEIAESLSEQVGDKISVRVSCDVGGFSGVFKKEESEHSDSNGLDGNDKIDDSAMSVNPVDIPHYMLKTALPHLDRPRLSTDNLQVIQQDKDELELYLEKRPTMTNESYDRNASSARSICLELRKMADCSEKLKDKDFQNWLKAALAVSIAKKGIEPYVSNTITEFHQNALKDILSTDEIKDEALCTTCTNNSLLPTTSKMKHVNYRRQDFLPHCPKQVCDRLRTKIVQSHAHHYPSWRNTRVDKWCFCPWEIAKCYMPPDGYTTANSALETDFDGILSVMMNHLEFTIDKEYCQKARDVTKRVIHSPILSMNDQELEDHLKVLINFLDCETYLENNPAAAAALNEIKKLKEANLKISSDDLTEVLKTNVKDEIKERPRDSLDLIDQERRCLEKFIEEINKLHSTKCERLDEVLTAKKEALQDIEEAKASIQEALHDIDAALASSNDESNRTSYHCRQKTRSSTEESYEALKHDLKEDLLSFNNNLYNTIPLSPLFEKRDTPLVGFYVQPTINCVQYPFSESIRSDIKTEINCLSEIFKTKRRNEIYVISKAGLGKTVFCKRLAVAWCHAHEERTIETTFETEEDLEMMRGFDFTFILLLREARASDCDIDKMIQHQIIRHLARSQRYKLDFLQDVLTKERCLIILDGLDEWTHPREKPCQTFNDIPHRKARQNCTILTTTRTWKFNLLSLSTNQIDNLVQITGLGEKAAGQLINNAVSKFSSDNVPVCKRNIQDFLHKLKNNTINKLKGVPLILIHLIYLWHKNQTIGESYCEIFSNIIGLHLYRAQVRSKDTGYPDIKKRKVDMPKCIEINEFCGSFHEVLKSLGQLAFHTFFDQDRENSLVFDIKIAKQYLRQHFEFCLSTGLITQNKGVENDLIGNVPRVSFEHKTFQEFFAALHVCTMVDEQTGMRPVKEICITVKDILSMSDFYIFLNGMCPDKARTLSHTLYRVVSSSDTVTGYRSDMGSWNYFVGYNETIKRIQSLFVDCVNESIDNGHTPVEFQIEDIIIDSDFQTESYSKVLKTIMETNGKDVKSVKVREVKTKVEFSDIVQLLRKNGRAALEKLDLKCEICDDSVEFLLQESVHSLKCFIIKGGQWLGNIWSHNHVRLSSKSIQIIWNMKQLEILYLRNIEMTHGQFDHLIGFVSASTNMRHIGLGFIKCQRHGDHCSDTKLDLSNHSQLRMLEIGSIPISEVQINTRSLEVCYVGSFAKSVVLSKVLTFLSNAPKLHVFCCGFLTSQTDIEKMLETITHLHNLQHIWLVNMDLGCKTFQLSPKLESIKNVVMIRIQMSIKTLKKLVEEVQQVKRTVSVGLFDCMVGHHEDYEREIRSLKLSNTVHVIQDETKSQKDFIFKTLG